MTDEQPPSVADAKPCTCHPDDNPPVPCAKQYALSECRSVADAAGAKDAEASFNAFADRYDLDSNEWLDMDVQTFYIEGYKAGCAAPAAPSVADKEQK